MIKKLLLIVTIVYLIQLDQNKKLVIYIEVFIKIYNWHYREQVDKTHEIVKLEKYLILRAKNLLNLGS